MLFKCRGCQAKDDEIRHLLALLDKAQSAANMTQARLAEIASPGAERRIAAPAPVPPHSAGPAPNAPSFPGYPRAQARPPIEVDESA